MKAEQLLDEQVALALGLPISEHCRLSDRNDPFGHFIDSYDKLRERHDRLGQEVVEAIQSQKFGGRLALEAFMEFGIRSSCLWDWDGLDEQPRYYEASDFLYHGTPKHIGHKLEVRQPYWQDANGRKFKHGSPAICTSDKPDLPITRSLLHENADTFKDRPFYLRLATDRRGKRHWFTLRENVDALREDEATGYMYVIKKREGPDYTKPYFDTVRARYLDEYRIHHNRIASTIIKMTVEDLPPDLLIIDLPKPEAMRALDYLHTYKTPLELSDRYGVLIEPFGGSWELDAFPNIHNH
jgi:hypothetical protein